jgi:flagellar hook-associated protein 1 FlgK
MSSLLSVMALSGQALSVQSAGIGVAGQNVANVNTPGYARRTARIETLPGMGAQLAGIGRSIDRFAVARAVTEGGLHGAATARAGSLASLEATLAPSGSPTIGDRTSAFFASINAVSQSPADATARNVALAAATQLSASISSAAASITTERGALLGKAQDTAVEVNTRLGQIARLNQQIVGAGATGGDGNALRDQRDGLVREVGDRIGVQSIEDARGAVTLLSSGSTLVDGGAASSVDVALGAGGNLAITVRHPGGSSDDVTGKVTSGSLGGVREARDVDAPKIAAQLDQLAYDLATSVNTVHAAGYGLDGQTGRPLFKPPAAVAGAAYAMGVDPSVAGKPDAIGAAKSAADLPGGNDSALALAMMASSPLGGAPTPAQAFATITGGLGATKSAADSDVTLRENTLAQADNLRDSASGVSVDEEMINLTSFQRSFEASMRVVSTVSTLLDDLIKGM